MARLEWDRIDRNYETGVDHGVLYFDNESVVWDGLISVQEEASASRGNLSFFEGMAFNVAQDIADYEATVQSYVFPYFLEEHILALLDGRTYTSDAQPFHFTYRTRYGAGHRLHLVYNVTATVESVVRETIGENIELSPFQFKFTTRPENPGGIRPTAHYFVDTNVANESHLFELEKILYGSDETHPYFPSAADLITLFNS